ncbi:hypothetical protein T12_12026 [Trichinella patagoniensis]|uniref:Uncharacterized protein n=1 Tax=Trichinella patagoniensis TaxID=990121 RepID=A0A0V0Z7L1_9BILA|nr:hypothetical protein T12_12026 [Trichinella patagoniensis]
MVSDRVVQPTSQWTVDFAWAAGQINYDGLTAIRPTFVRERVAKYDKNSGHRFYSTEVSTYQWTQMNTD